VCLSSGPPAVRSGGEKQSVITTKIVKQFFNVPVLTRAK
jgi:hypothetical protein